MRSFKVSLMFAVLAACADQHDPSESVGGKADNSSAPTCEELRDFSYSACRAPGCPVDFAAAEGTECEPFTECGIPNPCADSEILVCSETGFWGITKVFAQSSCVADPECPADFSAAEGTECAEAGKECGTINPCSFGQLLVCSDTGFWSLQTTFPANCEVDWQGCFADTEWGDVNATADELCADGCIAAPWCE